MVLTAANGNTPKRLGLLEDYPTLKRLNTFIGMTEADQDFLISVDVVKLDCRREFLRRSLLRKLDEAYSMLYGVWHYRTFVIDPEPDGFGKRAYMADNERMKAANAATIQRHLAELHELCRAAV